LRRQGTIEALFAGLDLRALGYHTIEHVATRHPTHIVLSRALAEIRIAAFRRPARESRRNDPLFIAGRLAAPAFATSTTIVIFEHGPHMLTDKECKLLDAWGPRPGEMVIKHALQRGLTL
jgi:hypothetical protein